jgi:hypothetical protein
MKENRIKGRKMKQKLISLIALLAIGALLTGCLAPSEDKGADWLEPGVEGVDYLIKPAEPGWNWYISSKFGFKQKYPADWKNFDMSADGFLIDDPEEDGFFCSMVFPMKEVEKDLGKIDSPWQLEKKMIEFDKNLESRSDFKLLKLTNFTLDGTPAAKAVYTYCYYDPERGKKFGSELKAIEVTTIKGKYHYSLSYDCAEVDTFDKYYDTVNKMINSFEFI